MPERILVPVDGSPESHAALEFALDRYGDDETTIVVLHVFNPIETIYAAEPGAIDQRVIERQRERAAAILDEAVEAASSHPGPVERVLVEGTPPAEIVDYVEEGDIDHVVVGSRGRTGLSRVLLGSVAEVVVRRSPVPVTVVR